MQEQLTTIIVNKVVEKNCLSRTLLLNYLPKQICVFYATVGCKIMDIVADVFLELGNLNLTIE